MSATNLTLQQRIGFEMAERQRAQTTHLGDLDGCDLHRKTPYGITNVTMTQFSIARHYGGIKFNGDDYTYMPDTDELIRNDVLKWKKKRDKARK